MDPNTTSLVLNGTLNATLNQPFPIFLNATLNQPSQTLKDWLPAATIFLGLLTLALGEWAKRSYDKYLKKVDRYIELINLIENLKENQKPGDPELQSKFIHQINLCWVVCSDDEMNKIIDLVSKFNDDRNKECRGKILSDFMITLRRNTLKIMPWDIRKTKLKPEDYEKIAPAMLRRFVLIARTGDFNSKLEDIKLTATAKVTAPNEQEETEKEP
jgi:hypothetical protein